MKTSVRSAPVGALMTFGLPLLLASTVWEIQPESQVTPSAVPDAFEGRDEVNGAALAGSDELASADSEQVQYWIERFSGDQRVTFQSFFERRGLFEGMIRSRLAERGLPSELLYLAMIESGFSTDAVSGAEAVGLWQLMAPTAQHLGLRVDEWVDERRDPFRATDAALDYLELLYGRYGSWHLAMAAYNAGPVRVDEALAATPLGAARFISTGNAGPVHPGAERFRDIRRQLPFETRHHVARVMAAAALARDAKAYGFNTRTEAPVTFDIVWVPGGTPLSQVAQMLELPMRRLRELNAHLIADVTPPDQVWGLRVPQGTGDQVVRGFAEGAPPT